MMLQSLVENAIKHGLEPKAEGRQPDCGSRDRARQAGSHRGRHRLGFGKSATAGTGIGLSNIRERLALLYGTKASLSITETAGGGTTVTITVPYAVRATDVPPI
jgi:sensor histidine kinase YesM